MTSRDLLIEIGTEELPPKALRQLSEAFQEQVENGLDHHKLGFSSSRVFATPRRLALLFTDLDEMQAPIQIEKYGPALAAAFDGDGQPTKAAEGFARSCGVDVSALQEKNDGKVSKLYFSSTRAGQPATDLLPSIINEALNALPIPKRMRWGSSRVEFVRPVHWVVILFGEDVVPATVLGIQSGKQTYGHRFHHPDPLTLNSPADYEQTLTQSAFVIPSFSKRKEQIRGLINEQADLLKAIVTIDEDLLEEVTALVEWPVALSGSFDTRFLSVPKEALVSSMKSHQKCFTLEDKDGNISPHFITVSNLQSTDPDKVVAGNERVIRPRLADAAFFFEQDMKQSLISRREKLRSVIFEQTLGTLYDKSERVSALSTAIASRLGYDTELSARAAQLAKCDLLTGMVGEFADLQGVMGYYYALHDNEADEVAQAIREQYLPRFAGDLIPESNTGIALALAERLDTIVGLFGIGQPPTGSKDPFALRRAALGVLRIIVERQLSLDLSACVSTAISQFESLTHTDNLHDIVLDFIFDRFRAWYHDAGIPANVFLAVAAVRPTSPLDFDFRIKAVRQFASLPEAETLSAANKRVSNILAKLETPALTDLDQDLLVEEAEQRLAKAIDTVRTTVQPMLLKQDYSNALTAMASLQQPVDQFFNDVMVNTEDDKLRINRQSLLQQLRTMFLEIADISLLQSS